MADSKLALPGPIRLAEWRIILLGKTGSGKSATGNSLLGSSVFESDIQSSSITKQCELQTKVTNGKTITVVDTPGFFDTDRSEAGIMTEVKRAVSLAAPGPHVFLYVFAVGTRFTNEENAALQKACRLFGKKFHDHCIIVFTHSGSLEKENISEEMYLSHLPENLRKLVKPDRTFFIENCITDYFERYNKEQTNKLFQMISAIYIRNNSNYYTMKDLQEAEEVERKRLNATRANVRGNSESGIIDGIAYGIAAVSGGVVSAVPTVVGGALSIATRSPEPLMIGLRMSGDIAGAIFNWFSR